MQTFEQKVKAMTAKEIIMAMVEGLRNPETKILMSTFGCIDDDGVCYGCAATNTIIKIDGGKQNLFEMESRVSVAFDKIIPYFEVAINQLRMGLINNYNEYANGSGFARIINQNYIQLPFLDNDYTEADILIYEQLANDQI